MTTVVLPPNVMDHIARTRAGSVDFRWKDGVLTFADLLDYDAVGDEAESI
nr:hypothetical protein [Altererythrobacter segetis]